MEIAVLFPTLIGISQADSETIRSIDNEVMGHEEMLKEMLSYSWGDNVLSSFEKEKNVFLTAQLFALRKFVEDSIIQFVGMTRTNNELQIDHQYTQSWINVTKKFGFQERHNHDRSVEGLPISGAYYFRTTRGDGNLAVFPADVHYRLFENHVIEPEVGKLVLFRSEVFHRVSANLTDFDRISFSFNYLLV